MNKKNNSKTPEYKTMMDVSNLYLELDRHLMQDAYPSNYLKQVCNETVFQQHPFFLLYRLMQVMQSPKYHPEGNVWNHILLVVDEAAKVKEKSKNSRVFMWAALLHDIGKATTTKNNRGKITAHGHDEAGVALVREFFQCFKEEEEFVSKICELIRYHMQILYVIKNLRLADIQGMKRHTDVHEVALLSFCDRMGRLNSCPEEEMDNVRLFLQACETNNFEGNYLI